MSIDLHLHSVYSNNGEYSVLELFKKAEDAGLKIAAIADEDSILATREMNQYKTFSPVKWISATQISVHHNKRKFQILAYGIDVNYAWFEEHASKVKKSQDEAIAKMLKLLSDLFKISFSTDAFKDFANGQNLTLNMIARFVLTQPSIEESEEMKKFKRNASRFISLENSFVKAYLSEHKKAYVEVYSASYYEAINAIHSSNGVAVLAHPGLNINEDNAFLLELVHLGLDGIECYSPYHSEIQNAFYVSFALKRQLLITCGSDFGRKKEKTEVGKTHCPLTADEIMSLFAKRGILV